MENALRESLNSLYVIPQLMLIGIGIIVIGILVSAWYNEHGHRSWK